MHHLEVFVCS